MTVLQHVARRLDCIISCLRATAGDPNLGPDDWSKGFFRGQAAAADLLEGLAYSLRDSDGGFHDRD